MHEPTKIRVVVVVLEHGQRHVPPGAAQACLGEGRKLALVSCVVEERAVLLPALSCGEERADEMRRWARGATVAAGH